MQSAVTQSSTKKAIIQITMDVRVFTPFSQSRSQSFAFNGSNVRSKRGPDSGTHMTQPRSVPGSFRLRRHVETPALGKIPYQAVHPAPMGIR